jgi:hypothetical protein
MANAPHNTPPRCECCSVIEGSVLIAASIVLDILNVFLPLLALLCGEHS